ncbi:DUF2339 domain-containing protein [bacterium]|nr:DUF2339 domain-containing protein [bacterium]MBU1957561.1 DUF2339 domain-containing protein [bacterium]
MELLLLITFILLVLILIKVSNILNRLEQIEHLLKKEPKVEVKHEVLKSVVELIVTSDEHSKIKTTSSLKDLNKVKERLKESSVKSPNLIERLTERFKENSKKISLEELLFGNIILKISIVAFILGIALFLKYSIDKDWIPIWGRVLIGIVVGIMMLLGGIKMIHNQHKLFSEGLFGGGVAVLYLSIFAAYALEGFKFIDVTYAFASMIVITILAGIISIRFDAKSTAIFGLIGGFATPFLLNTGSENYVGLLSYMLILNVGVLYISIYKNWSLLSWLAFVITSLTALVTVWETWEDFTALLLLYTAFFIIYSVVPFIAEIREKSERLSSPSVLLFWANFVVAILSFLALFRQYEIALIYYTAVTVVLAAYLLVYASILTKKGVLLKNLFYIVLAQSIALLLVTPAFIFEGSSLTIFWAIESLMLLWISTKSNEKTYALFALLGFGVTMLRYLVLDVVTDYQILVYDIHNVQIMLYVKSLALISLFVIGSFFMAYRLVKNSSLNFEYIASDLVRVILFMCAFLGTYLVMTFISSLLCEVYSIDIFSIIYMLIIALFGFLLYRSAYSETAKILYTVFIGLMLIGFVDNIFSISSYNTLISLLNFLVFMAVAGFIYSIAFKDSRTHIAQYQLRDVMLGAGVGLLFIFLNVEIYHIVKFYSPEATKFAMTLLWIIFGIVLFVYGIMKEVNIAKPVGTVLIFLAILKAFFVDLANLDSIYRIVLFLILGAILFGLSYFYQSKQEKKQ